MQQDCTHICTIRIFNLRCLEGLYCVIRGHGEDKKGTMGVKSEGKIKEKMTEDKERWGKINKNPLYFTNDIANQRTCN